MRGMEGNERDGGKERAGGRERREDGGGGGRQGGGGRSKGHITEYSNSQQLTSQ